MYTHEAANLYIEDCMYRQLTRKTISNYRWALDKLTNTHVEMPEDHAAIKRLISSQDLGDQSRFDLWRALRTFYHWYSREFQVTDTMTRVPAPNLRPTLPRTLSPEEIHRVLSSADSRRDLALISTPLDNGIRLSEITSMTWPHITGSQATVDGKRGQRTVPLSNNLRQLLIGLGDGYAVWTGRKGRLTVSGVQAAIRRTMYRARITPPKAGPHLLRHTFGKLYIMNGGDVFSLQRIMGHRNLQTTMIYVYMNTEDLIEQHRKFSPLANLQLLPGHAQEEAK